MSVKSNGDSNDKKVIAGSVLYPANTQWPFANSDTFRLSSEGYGVDHTIGVVVPYNGTYVKNGANFFLNTPIVTATISGGSGFGLTARVGAITKYSFTLFIYNPTSSYVSPPYPITVNWIATEPTQGKISDDPYTLIQAVLASP